MSGARLPKTLVVGDGIGGLTVAAARVRQNVEGGHSSPR